MNKSGTNRIVVDWDGTCVEEVWPGQGDWLPGAEEALHDFLLAGYEVVVFSSRLSKYDIDGSLIDKPKEIVKAMRDKLNDAGLDDVEIWLEPHKPAAVIYIDDKGYRFNGDWEEVVDYVLGVKT